MNTDYKIIAKLLASRLKLVLPSIINNDQSGYLKGQYIGQNIRILEDTTFLLQTKKTTWNTARYRLWEGDWHSKLELPLQNSRTFKLWWQI